VRPSTPEDETAKLAAVFSKMPASDRRVAEAQQFCPILEQNRLGSMGTPVKVVIEGQPGFLCCDGCRESALANPKETLAKVAEFSKTQPKASPAVASSGEPADVAEAEIQSALAKLSSADREVAIAQRFCVVLGDSRLGSMGMPEKLVIDGKTVFVCCEGC